MKDVWNEVKEFRRSRPLHRLWAPRTIIVLHWPSCCTSHPAAMAIVLHLQRPSCCTGHHRIALTASSLVFWCLPYCPASNRLASNWLVSHWCLPFVIRAFTHQPFSLKRTQIAPTVCLPRLAAGEKDELVSPTGYRFIGQFTNLNWLHVDDLHAYDLYAYGLHSYDLHSYGLLMT